MDPLSALGVAASVAQFVGFGIEVLKATSALRTNKPLALEHFEAAAQDLKSIDKSLRAKMASHAESSLPVEAHRKALLELLSRCSLVAGQLIQVIESLSTKAKSGKWKTFQAAIQSVWRQSKIDELERTLESLRGQAVIRTLAYMNSKLDDHASQQAEQSERQKAEIVDVLAVNRQELHAVTNKLRTALDNNSKSQQSASESNSTFQQSAFSVVQSAVLKLQNGDQLVLPAPDSKRSIDESEYQRSAGIMSMTIRGEKSNMHGEDTSSAQQKLPDIKIEHSPRESYALEMAILDCLKFRYSTDRYENISKAHARTFEWIFSEPQGSDVIWDSFPAWLTSDISCYWINGKPASGKSTLAKYISQHETAKQYLSHWSGSAILTCASFFFWHLGTTIQKSMEGLLRSLLHDVLNQHRWLIYSTMPELVVEAMKISYRPLEEPTWPELKRWFEFIINRANADFKLFFIIDGLDEYSGDYVGLTNFIKAIASPNIKILISSRPIPVCREAFQHFPRLSLQDLTQLDMRKYILDEFSSKSISQVSELDQVARIVLEKASGVFLWVILVVKSLLEGLTSGDRMDELVQRTEELPPDLKDLFYHILRNVPARYQKQSCQMLKLALLSLPVESKFRGHDTFAIQFSFAEDEWESVKGMKCGKIKKKEELRRLDQMEARILSRCCGLLEFRDIKYKHDGIIGTARRPVVQFIHKTAIEFLEEDRPDIFDKLTTDGSFHPYQVLFDSTLALAKTYPPSATLSVWESMPYDPNIFWYSMRTAFEYAKVAYEAGQPVPESHIIEADIVFAELWSRVRRIEGNGNDTGLLEKPRKWQQSYPTWRGDPFAYAGLPQSMQRSIIIPTSKISWLTRLQRSFKGRIK